MLPCLGQIDFSNRGEFDGTASDNGTVTLRWDAQPGVSVELEQAAEATFAQPLLRYRGSDPASVVSGLPEGTHFFRLREAGGDWSPALAVQVEFFPRSKLFVLLGAGGLVVVATVGTIVAGALRTRGEGATV